MLACRKTSTVAGQVMVGTFSVPLNVVNDDGAVAR
jgi:hypothetical protein